MHARHMDHYTNSEESIGSGSIGPALLEYGDKGYCTDGRKTDGVGEEEDGEAEWEGEEIWKI